MAQGNAMVRLNDPLRQRLNCKCEDAHHSWHSSVALSSSFALYLIITE